MGTKVKVLTKDYISHLSCMNYSTKYQNYILNIIFKTKYPLRPNMTHIITKIIIIGMKT
jgi:hypothetical protein